MGCAELGLVGPGETGEAWTEIQGQRYLSINSLYWKSWFHSWSLPSRKLNQIGSKCGTGSFLMPYSIRLLHYLCQISSLIQKIWGFYFLLEKWKIKGKEWFAWQGASCLFLSLLMQEWAVYTLSGTQARLVVWTELSVSAHGFFPVVMWYLLPQNHSTRLLKVLD